MEILSASKPVRSGCYFRGTACYRVLAASISGLMRMIGKVEVGKFISKALRNKIRERLGQGIGKAMDIRGSKVLALGKKLNFWLIGILAAGGVQFSDWLC